MGYQGAVLLMIITASTCCTLQAFMLSDEQMTRLEVVKKGSREVIILIRRLQHGQDSDFANLAFQLVLSILILKKNISKLLCLKREGKRGCRQSHRMDLCVWSI
jgi:hypothetical protein